MKTVMIYGVARSGTSMTCGIANCLGIDIATEKPRLSQLRHNPKGMFEIGNIMGLAREFEKELKETLRAGRLPDFEKSKENLTPAINEFLKNHAPKDKNANWGFKTPGIYTLDILPDFLNNPYVIGVSRNLIENVKSFQMMRLKEHNVRTPYDVLMSEFAVNQAVYKRLCDRCKYPLIRTTYEDIKQHPWEEAQKIADFLGVQTTDEMKRKVLEFVEPNLHTWVDIDGEAQPKEVIEWEKHQKHTKEE